MDTPFIGEIALVGFNFAPNGWALCDGSLLPIAQNTALFSLLGTQYGGDGITNFALPDLRGRAPIHFGAGTALSPREIGERGGAEVVALTKAQLPPHTHSEPAAGRRTSGQPTGRAPAIGGDYGRPSTTAKMAPTGPVGGGQPHENMPPFLVMNYIIALFGIYPPRA